jgi:hypothetical protein
VVTTWYVPKRRLVEEALPTPITRYCGFESCGHNPFISHGLESDKGTTAEERKLNASPVPGER